MIDPICNKPITTADLLHDLHHLREMLPGLLAAGYPEAEIIARKIVRLERELSAEMEGVKP